MDDSALRSAFVAHTTGQEKFTRRMAITIALMADQSPKQIVLRLEQLGLLRPGAWEWFADNGGITKEQIEDVRTSLVMAKET